MAKVIRSHAIQEAAKDMFSGKLHNHEDRIRTLEQRLNELEEKGSVEVSQDPRLKEVKIEGIKK